MNIAPTNTPAPPYPTLAVLAAAALLALPACEPNAQPVPPEGEVEVQLTPGEVVVDSMPDSLNEESPCNKPEHHNASAP